MAKILIIGAGGQIGSSLSVELCKKYGNENVIASDINESLAYRFNNCLFEKLDVLNKESLINIVTKHNVTQIYHLAAILSAAGESNPLLTWRVNTEGLLNVLEVVKDHPIEKLFWPSSIAVFGTNTPKKDTPQNCITDPLTVYGISKLAGERWCAYYHQKYNIDVRSLRYPGLIGHQNVSGAGTTDYAVAIYRAAVQHKKYECYLAPNTRLPMMYLPDAIIATVELMEAPSERISVRDSYNINVFSFSPAEVYQSIKKHIPEFSITYNPDFRQVIANSWPHNIDDTQARSDWGWKPTHTLESMTAEILKLLEEEKCNTLQK